METALTALALVAWAVLLMLGTVLLIHGLVDGVCALGRRRR